jgi:hypothetical protein
MGGVGLKTPVTITMGNLLAGVAAFGAVLWAVLTFTIGGLRDDVGAIRDNIKGLNVEAVMKAIDGLQTADRSNITRANEINVQLTQQIQGLRIDFVKYSEKFDSMSSKFDSMNKSIDSLSSKIDKLDSARSVPVSYDPKQLMDFTEYLKKYAGDNSRVVVVPFPLTGTNVIPH